MARAKKPTKRVVPDLNGYAGVGIRGLSYKVQNTDLIHRNREAIAKELLMLAGSNIGDILDWGPGGVRLRTPEEIGDEKLRCIKKIKVTATEHGQNVEIEMHDKMGALRLAAKAAGYLDAARQDSNRPTVVGINIKAPSAEDDTVLTAYEVVEDTDAGS
jgi:hypothetical protein